MRDIFWPVLLACALITVMAGVAIRSAKGQTGHHGHGHAERHDWYRELKQPGTGYSCCSGLSAENPNGDCRPTIAELRDDGWYALLDGRWVPVPRQLVLDPQFNKEPIRAHICASKSGMIYCFLGAGDGS